MRFTNMQKSLSVDGASQFSLWQIFVWVCGHIFMCDT